MISIVPFFVYKTSMAPLAEMNSNGKGLDEGTGVHRMRTLLSKQLFIFILLIIMKFRFEFSSKSPMFLIGSY